ncbi:ATP-dependent zinc metalloprotease FTSH 4, mitochondrial [Sesamum angolense]|uniref:ATP-dependent zinc metalloprotease FTSH 4, mitochondrial n=1 Tax=Sesamum angolense TaxID=2727404 RepID=A0AAE2BXC5_9LAMI|nr:ATP-dependent zinc metalloprotease FTSH 4, mitochondrial [Sesamum angolense]
MALRRLLSEVKRQESQLRQLSNLAARPYRTSPYARGAVHELSSNVRASTLGRSSYFGSLARRVRDNFGSGGTAYLKELNHRNDPEAVIRLFESQPSLHSDESAIAEYVRALVKVDRLDERLSGATSSQVDAEGIGALSAVRNVGKSSKDGILGTASAPIHMVTAEGGNFKEQLWRTVRALGLAFLLISGVGALIEDRGIDDVPMNVMYLSCLEGHQTPIKPEQERKRQRVNTGGSSPSLEPATITHWGEVRAVWPGRARPIWIKLTILHHSSVSQED